jgi:hypothetical protein
LGGFAWVVICPFSSVEREKITWLLDVLPGVVWDLGGIVSF